MLLNYWDKTTKVTTSPLTTKYTMAYVRMRYGIEVYEYHKIRETQYSYVGMNYATAKRCQEAEYERYRRVYTQEYNEYYNYVHRRELVPCADVTISNEGGHMWRVDVKVTEDQLQYDMKRDDPKFVPFWDDYGNIETLDEFGPYLRISGSEMMGQALLLDYEFGNLGTFDIDTLQAEVSTDGNTWTQVQKIVRPDRKIQLNVGIWGKYNRLRYGEAVSNAVLKEDAHEYTNEFEITNVEYWVGGKWRLEYVQDLPGFDYSKMKVYYMTADSEEWTEISEQCTLLNGIVLTSLDDPLMTYGFKLVFGDFEATYELPYSPEQDLGNGALIVEGCVPNGVGSSEQIVSGIDLYSEIPDSGEGLELKGSNDGDAWDSIAIREYTDIGTSSFGGHYFKIKFITQFKYLRLYFNGQHETSFRREPVDVGPSTKVLGIERTTYNGEYVMNVWYDGVQPDGIETKVRNDPTGEWVEQQIIGQHQTSPAIQIHPPTNYNYDDGVILKATYRGFDEMKIEIPLSREQH